MNKKGMTLVELIAVIAILGILTVMVSPAIVGIRDMVMQNTLDSKITMIKAGAIEYAMEHINEIPSKVDVAKDNNTVPCICDCTQDGIKGKYSNDAGSKTCSELCGTYDEEKDKTTDGAYKMTSKSGLTECVEPNKYCKIISVNDLIVRGYVVGDRENKEELENPFSEEPLNTSQVCIRYTNNDAYNRRLIAYIIGEGNLGK